MTQAELDFPAHNMTLSYTSVPCYSDVWLSLTDWGKGANVVRFRGLNGGNGAGPAINFGALAKLPAAFERDQWRRQPQPPTALPAPAQPKIELPCEDTAGNSLTMQWLKQSHMRLTFNSKELAMGHGCGQPLAIDIHHKQHPATLAALQSFYRSMCPAR